MAKAVHIDRNDLAAADMPPPLPEHLVPEGWMKGELLSQTTMASGFRFQPFYERVGMERYIEFMHADEAQNFIGWWYQR